MTKEELEKEAEEWIKDHSGLIGSYKFVKFDYDSMQKAYLAGAELGYNKANEWHDLQKDPNDLPEVDNRIVLCVCSNGYINGKRNHILKLLTRKEFPLFQPVYAWKEIVLPELKENE